MSIGGGKMANHIKYIDIHKFKGIKDINIYDMKSINIFVGDNNSGKTTILEAIKFFEKPIPIAKEPNAKSPTAKVFPRCLKPPHVLIITPPAIIPANPTTSTAVRYQ